MNRVPKFVTEEWYRERWVRGSRYYDMLVHQDLWGEWVATRVNGQVTSSLGRVVHAPFEDQDAALHILDQWRRRRVRRGYTLFGEGRQDG